MPRGRKPKPVESRKREGGTAKRGAVSHRAVPATLSVGGRVVDLKDVRPPADFDEFGRSVWTELVSLLHDAGMLDRVDLAAIRAAVLQYVDHERVHAALESRDPGLDEDLAALIAERERSLRDSSAILRAKRILLARRLSNVDESGRSKPSEDVPANEVNSVLAAEDRLARATERLTNLHEYARLRRAGVPVALGSTGQLVEHPLVGTKRAAAALFLRFAEQFGATTLARTRIQLGKAAGRRIEADLEDALGKGRKKRAS